MESMPAECVRLFKRAFWLIKLRWFAIVGVTLATIFVQFFVKISLSYIHLYIISASLLILNTAYYFISQKYKIQLIQNRHVKKFINFQITADFFILTALLHYSGGIENPLIVFYIFHMLIASILLARIDSYIQTTVAIILFSLMTFLEYSKVISHVSLNKYISELLFHDVYYLIIAFGVFIIASYVVVYIMTTITDQLRKQQLAYSDANKELRKKDKIKDEYVQRVTHDIKGHIAVINSSLEILKRKSLGPINEQYDVFINRASIRTENLIDFIVELLKITNLRLSNRQDISIFPITDVIFKSIHETEHLATDKKIELQHNVAENLGTIEAESFSVQEAISNLLQNAVKYTPEKGIVKLTAFSEKDFIQIEISDNGIGIPEQDLDKVFDEFFRASNVKKSYEGGGLGLALVKQIIKRQHGQISVKSKIGEGTTFTIKLPTKMKK